MAVALPIGISDIENNSRVVVGYTSNNTTSSKVIRATTGFVFFTSAAQRSIASTSASDTAAGTGAQTVTYTYFDSNMLGPFTDTVTMNGTLAVNTNATNVQFIETVTVATVGSGGSNVGTIEIFAATSGGGADFACINPGDNASYWCHHFVNVNKSALIVAMDCSGSLSTGSSIIYSTGDPRATNLPQVNVSGTKRHAVTQTPTSWDAPVAIPGPNFVFMSETPDNATSVGTNSIYGSFQYIDI
jgi:hypothetical protein